jgi:hypothetical protein
MPIWQRKPIWGAFTDDEGLAGASVHESEEGQSGPYKSSEKRVRAAILILGLHHRIPLRAGDWTPLAIAKSGLCTVRRGLPAGRCQKGSTQHSPCTVELARRGVAECDEPTGAPGIVFRTSCGEALAANSFRLAQDSIGTTETLAFLHSSMAFRHTHKQW